MIALARALGWCGSSGMGPVPLSALEISAWCIGTGETLTHWEFATLSEMSAAYVGGSYATEAPWRPTVVKMALATASFSSPQRGAAAKKPAAGVPASAARP